MVTEFQFKFIVIWFSETGMNLILIDPSQKHRLLTWLARSWDTEGKKPWYLYSVKILVHNTDVVVPKRRSEILTH